MRFLFSLTLILGLANSASAQFIPLPPDMSDPWYIAGMAANVASHHVEDCRNSCILWKGCVEIAQPGIPLLDIQLDLAATPLDITQAQDYFDNFDDEEHDGNTDYNTAQIFRLASATAWVNALEEAKTCTALGYWNALCEFNESSTLSAKAAWYYIDAQNHYDKALGQMANLNALRDTVRTRNVGGNIGGTIPLIP